MPATITARARVQGLHQWPGAPDRRSYLRALHRHEFHVEVKAAVFHSDRDTEFHDLGERAAVLLRGLGQEFHPESTLVTFGASSCEMLAEKVGLLLIDEGVPVLSVTVSEDGEHDGTWAPVA